MYKEGDYFSNPNRHDEDAPYKVESLFRVINNFHKKNKIVIKSYADVGCGSGRIVKLLSQKLIENGSTLEKIRGYDISPHVENIKDEKITFKFADYTKDPEKFDLVTLNDVFEHVVNPQLFLNSVGKKSKYILMHIPIEDSLIVNLRGLQKKKIQNPGHLLFLNINSALNLITLSGLQLIDYDWSYDSIYSPSNRTSILQKISFPFKVITIKINPYLYSVIFGLSLVVLAKGYNNENDI